MEKGKGRVEKKTVEMGRKASASLERQRSTRRGRRKARVPLGHSAVREPGQALETPEAQLGGPWGSQCPGLPQQGQRGVGIPVICMKIQLQRPMSHWTHL